MRATRHLFCVLRDGVFGDEVRVDGREELRWGFVGADAGHLVGDGRVRVRQVRAQWLVFLYLAVGRRGVVLALAGVVAGSGGA